MQTSTFISDNVGDPEPIVVNAPGRRVTLRENGAAGTTPYNIRAPYKTSPPMRLGPGESFAFVRQSGQASFVAGEVIGYIETVLATATFSMVSE